MVAIETVETIPVDDIKLEGELILPEEARGLVIFAHGSGSSRKSPRNNYVAKRLRQKGPGTLLFDLLTEEEDQDRDNRFDIPLLVERLLSVTDWTLEKPETKGLNLGYFGSSTGAAAALLASIRKPSGVKALVSRGGRVDLASEQLGDVTASTLFIVGGNDTQVLKWNRLAYQKLNCEKELEVIPGAGHLFEEEGQLEQVAELAANWFEAKLT